MPHRGGIEVVARNGMEIGATDGFTLFDGSPPGGRDGESGSAQLEPGCTGRRTVGARFTVQGTKTPRIVEERRASRNCQQDQQQRADPCADRAVHDLAGEALRHR